jgi:hypothetical protein
VASSNDGVNFGPPETVTDGVDLTVADGQYLKVTVSFTRSSSDDDNDGTNDSPILYDLTIRAAQTLCANTLDDFDRPNGGIGGNWGGSRGGYRISGQEATVRRGGPIYWQPDSFGEEQEVCVTLTEFSPYSAHHTLMLKVQDHNNWGAGVILVNYNATNGKIDVEWYDVIHGRWPKTTITPPEAVQEGDQLGARALADGTVEVYINQELIGTVSTGSFYAGKGGQIGLWFMDAWHAMFDDFAGGDLPE